MLLVFYLPTFSTPCMSHLLYLIFRCDFDVMQSLENLEELKGTKHSPCPSPCPAARTCRAPALPPVCCWQGAAAGVHLAQVEVYGRCPDPSFMDWMDRSRAGIDRSRILVRQVPRVRSVVGNIFDSARKEIAGCGQTSSNI